MILDSDILQEIEELAMFGVSDQTICDHLGMDYEIWEKGIEDDEVLLQTVETGRRMGIEKVTRALFNEAIDGDVGAAKFYLMNKDKLNWVDLKHNKVALTASNETVETAKMFASVIESGNKKNKK